MDSHYYCADLGCVSICIERGKLTGHLDSITGGPDPYEWTGTDPPAASRNIQASKPRIVRSEWFVPLNSSNGLPYLFEYRNSRPQDRNEDQPEAHGEIGHDPFCEEEIFNAMEEAGDDDTFRGDRWGLADYDDSAKLDEFRKAKKRKRSGHQPTQKTRRIAESVGSADCGTRVRAECADRDDDEDIYLKAESEVKIERARDRSSQTQEPTPAREDPEEEMSTAASNAVVEIPGRTFDEHSIEQEAASQGAQPLGPEPDEPRHEEDDDDYIEKLHDELEAVNLRAVELHRMIRSAQQRRATRVHAT